MCKKIKSLGGIYPPYHPLENAHAFGHKSKMKWQQKKNIIFKMVDVGRLTNETLDSVSKSDWEKCVKHAEKIQDED